MSEIWDMLDKNGHKTGRTFLRSEAANIAEGDYYLVVHIYIKNSKNQWLMQKRSLLKESFPGEWDITGGAVVSGEDSVTGAMREVEEEIGVSLATENLKLFARIKKKNHFVDIYKAEKDFDTENCVLDPLEVDAVKWVSADELLAYAFDRHEKTYDAIVKALVSGR
ncbi:MAG: NUDIX domain-containing protein [Clostridiales bacterium]|jgi:8-oxo-dGTP pyrophosphatase MutT (NUDIX family)|nr:NUDIX domain-containing protein [Clostridiales bacterium]